MDIDKFKKYLISIGFYQETKTIDNGRTFYFAMTNMLCFQVYFYERKNVTVDYEYRIYRLGNLGGLYRLKKFGTPIDNDIMLYLKFLPTVYHDLPSPIRTDIDNWCKAYYLGYEFKCFQEAIKNNIDVMYNITLETSYDGNKYNCSTLHLNYVTSYATIEAHYHSSIYDTISEGAIKISKVLKAKNIVDAIKKLYFTGVDSYCRKKIIDDFLEQA